MTTSTTSGAHRWSQILSVLAPGPASLCMGAWIFPTGWRAVRAVRDVAPRRAEDDAAAGRAQR